MEGKKILYVSSEMLPYTVENFQSTTAFETTKLMNDGKNQIRIFMPKFGLINERRHQLHEVIRLSGMNLVINDVDQPLIIKVASIPKERLQTYFIDNEEYFKRKFLYGDEENSFFKDNDERFIFFAKGVIETIKKLNWIPDVVHLHGWFSSLIPFFVRELYKDDAVLNQIKFVYGMYNAEFKEELGVTFKEKLKLIGLDVKNIDLLEKGTYLELHKLILSYVDGIVLAEPIEDETLLKEVESTGTLVLEPKETIDVAALKTFYTELF